MGTILDCVFVGCGGALGAVSRYLMGLIPLKHSSGFPLITLLVNVIGAFCIGLIFAAFGNDPDINPRLILFLKVGICGGFTTFSTFSLESVQLLQNGKAAVGITYMLLSVLLCLAAVYGATAAVNAIGRN